MVLTKVAHNDAKSLKKIGCIFPHHLGGWGGQTLVWKIPQNFYFSYFVSFPYELYWWLPASLSLSTILYKMYDLVIGISPNAIFI